jgi:predicted 3-demethylubiquinone-9 3-methyltransferase (glyoxalase superfamily)
MKPIITCLTFKKEAEEAVELYVSVFSSVFGNSRILKTTYFGKDELEALKNVPEVSEDIMPGPAGSVKTVRFQLNGQELLAVNGGGYFGKFTESTSLYVTCETQEQIDKLWNELTKEGMEQPCGWLKDKYGVSWQIAPAIIQEIEEGPDLEKAQRVMKAIYAMKKLDIEKIKQAIEERKP